MFVGINRWRWGQRWGSKMSKTIHRLPPRCLATFNEPGRHADGGNLYLSITASGSKSWLFMYRAAGRQREMGLGSAGPGAISLARARELAAGCRDLLARGLDPIEARSAKDPARASVTFGKAAEDLIASKQSG